MRLCRPSAQYPVCACVCVCSFEIWYMWKVCMVFSSKLLQGNLSFVHTGGPSGEKTTMVKQNKLLLEAVSFLHSAIKDCLQFLGLNKPVLILLGDRQ